MVSAFASEFRMAFTLDSVSGCRLGVFITTLTLTLTPACTNLTLT